MKIGLYRRAYNKTLKEAMLSKNIRNTDMDGLCLKYGVKIGSTKMGWIMNFKHNPTEDEKIAISMVLETPIDDIFPEYYDEIYGRLSGIKQNGEIEGSKLSLSSTEVLQLESSDDSVEYAEDRLRNDTIDNVIERVLSTREKELIKMRFGLSGEVAYTLEEVGKRLGVTRERVRQMEAKALEKIRMSHQAKVLRETTFEPDQKEEWSSLWIERNRIFMERSRVVSAIKHIKIRLALKQYTSKHDMKYLHSGPDLIESLTSQLKAVDNKIRRI